MKMYEVRWHVKEGVGTPTGQRRSDFSAINATGVEDAKTQLRAAVGPRLGIVNLTDQAEKIIITHCAEAPPDVVKKINDHTATLERANALLRQNKKE